MRLNGICRGSALFYCAYPSQAAHVPSVKHIDFSCPVLDFVLEKGCQVLVSVDTAWSSPLNQEGTERTAVRLIEWAGEEVRSLFVYVPSNSHLP